MLTAPSPLAFVGIAFSFWTSAYLASRTSYSSATRVVRWALIVMGVRFMHDVLYSNAKSLDEALLWQRLFFRQGNGPVRSGNSLVRRIVVD